MYRVFSLALLLCFSPFALAQYGLVKIDLNQVNFGDLAPGGGGGGGAKGGGGKAPGIKQNDPLAQTDGAVWIYGFFELSAANSKKELEKFQPVVKGGPSFVQITHRRWGRERNYFLFPAIGSIESRYIPKPKILDDFREQNGAAKEPDGYLRLALWCLTHGLPDKIDGTMGLMKKAGADRPAYVNYNRFKAELKKPPTADLPIYEAAELKEQGYRTMDSPEGHFRVYFKADKENLNDAAVKWRLSRMDETFNNFYLWFAFQEYLQDGVHKGLPNPPLPAYRLPVIVENPKDFAKRLKDWGIPPQGDGFTLRQEGLVMLTSRPTGDICQYLERNLNPVRGRYPYSVEEYLKGFPTPEKDGENVKMVQTLTILQKIVEDDALTLAINQECTRQLLSASGFVSRNVAAPEWIQRGLVSYFETPPNSLYPGFGLPRGSYLEAIRNVHKTLKPGKNSPRSGDILLNLVSDNYFRQAASDLRLLRELDLKKALDRKGLQEKAKESHDLAQATAWSLVYYLAVQRKMHYLTRYAEQLNRLPRHAIVTPQTLQYCFAQAFDLADVTDPTRLDNHKMQAFAEHWLSYMANVQVESPELEAFINPAK